MHTGFQKINKSKVNQINKIRNKIVLVLLVPVILVLHGFGNPVGTDESAVKAMFIYNFTKYFDWSPIESKPEFVIAVYGKSTVAGFLDEIAHRKTINGKPIVIKTVASFKEIEGSQMLFIPGTVTHINETIQMSLEYSSLIIITESTDALKSGSHINLINVDGKLRFQLNEKQMKNNSIKFSRELSALSIKKD